MPKEISQTKASTVWFHLNLESKKQIDKKKTQKNHRHTNTGKKLVVVGIVSERIDQIGEEN